MSSNRIRVLFVSLLAVFAVGAVASASASAHEFLTCQKVAAGTGKFAESECIKTGAPEEFEWKGIAAAVKVTGTDGVSKFESALAGVKVIIECEESTFTGELEAAGKSKGKVEFEGCKIFENKNGIKTLLTCKVAPITFEFVDEVITGSGFGPEDEFRPTAANKTKFVIIKLTGCALESETEVKTATEGKGQVCQLPEAEVGKVGHVVDCSSSGSKELKFGTEKASFYSVLTVKLTSKERWLIR